MKKVGTEQFRERQQTIVNKIRELMDVIREEHIEGRNKKYSRHRKATPLECRVCKHHFDWAMKVLSVADGRLVISESLLDKMKRDGRRYSTIGLNLYARNPIKNADIKE